MEDVPRLAHGHGHGAHAGRVDLGRLPNVGRPPAVRTLRHDEPRRPREVRKVRLDRAAAAVAANPNAGERDCPVPRRYRGSSRIEGYWNVFLCEACRAPPRPRDPRIPFSVDGVGDKLNAQNKGSYAVFGLKHPGRSGRRRLAARGGLGPNARAYWATRSSGRASILDHARPNGLGRPELAPHPFVPIRYDRDDQAPFSPRSALCGGLGMCPGSKKCYERINDDRATYKEGVRATYKCAEGPPGSKWNLAAADTPPSRRVGRRRAYKRAREELAMLEREAQPKEKPVKTL